MGKHHHHHTHNKENQAAEQVIAQGAVQSEAETVVVRKSSNVDVTQFEGQPLYLAQLALEGALQALLIFSRTHDTSIDTKELEAIIQEARQVEREKVKVVQSRGVRVTQVESQHAAILQAAVDLLAQIVAKL